MKITFKNWEKTVGRKDIKRPLWFRIDNNIYETELWEKLDGEEFKTYVFLLCVASIGQNQGTIHVNSHVFFRKAAVNEKVLHRTIAKLAEINEVSIRADRGTYGPRTGHERVTNGTLHYITEQNITEQNNNAQSSHVEHAAVFDLESIYREYPRKEGKTRGMKLLAGKMKTQEDFDKFCMAVRNYASKVKREKTEPKFIKHFATFVNCFEDYLDQPTPEELKPYDPWKGE